MAPSFLGFNTQLQCSYDIVRQLGRMGIKRNAYACPVFMKPGRVFEIEKP